MSKIQPKRFTVEEFQDQKDWIAPLFSSLNQFMQEVAVALGNGLNVADNLQQEIREIKFVNSSTNFPIKFTTKFAINPRGLLPIYVFNNTLGSYSAAAPWLEWSYANGEVSISAISGLTASSTYTIRLLVFFG